MPLSGNYLTIRIQQHSSGVTNEVVAETTSVDAQFTAEALESTAQADGITSKYIGGKNTITVSGDYLLASDGDQFTRLFAHADAGDKIEVDIYRSGTIFITTEGVFTSLSQAAAYSDSLVTGAYSMSLDVVAEGGGYGPVLNTRTIENTSFPNFSNATATGFDANCTDADNYVASTATSPDEIAMLTDEQFFVEYTLVLNSGTAPSVNLTTVPGGVSNTDEGYQILSAGSNNITFTSSGDNTCVLSFVSFEAASNFELTDLSIRKVL